jgi:CzcA family heavy metal efflux pump
MNIAKIAINNKVTVYILLLIIVIFGIISYVSMPREAAPSITIPYVFVTTPYIGVSPADMENLVTQKIETEVKGIKDIKKIISVSQESFSNVTIEFNPDVKIEDALQKVRDKVSIAKTKMPADIEEPVITEINFSEMPMLYVNLTGNFGLSKLKDIGDNIADKIEAIPGVLSVDVSGGLEREIKINADANKLKYYNIALSDINAAIGSENLNIPGGTVDAGSSSFLVRVPGEFENPMKLSDVVVKIKDGTPIYLRDLAAVEDGFKDRTTYSRENGVEAVTLVIKKRSGENIVNIADKIKELLKKEESDFPAGLRYSFTGDESKSIRSTVHELENGIITGVLLVVMILLLAMGFKNAFLVSLSIPISFLISFIVLSSLGVTLNIVVLFSLILVLGIIVDDAVVVTENIYRLQEKEGWTPHDAAIEGPREVQIPVFIATLTIISSFFPLLFFPGIVGGFMKFLPITLIVCLFSSLFVSLVISPVLASKFINFKKDREKQQKSRYNPFVIAHFWFDRFFIRLVKHYEKVIRYAVRHKFLTIGGTFAILIIVFVVYIKFSKGVEFFPQIEPQQAFIYVTLPDGSSVQKTNEAAMIIEEKLKPFNDLDYYVSNVGSEIGDFGGGDKTNVATITLTFKDKIDREQSSFVTFDQIRDAVTGITTADIRLAKQQGGPPTGPPVNIEISGDDFDKLGELSEQIKREIRGIPGIADIKDNYDAAKPEIRIIVDREKAALYKLNTASIAGTVRNAISGTVASKYRVGKDEYDITVRLDSVQRNDISMIENLYIADKDGHQIPLSSVARVEFAGGLSAINRKDLSRVVTISANAEGRLGNDVLNDVKAKLETFKMPEGYLITYTGEQEDQEESQAFLGQSFILSIFLIFFFIVIEFNSVKTPIIIMSTVVLSLIGVLIGLLVTGTPFGIIMTGIGVISLGGIVVRNAIVLLDFQKELEKRGLSKEEAVIQSGVVRLRPVFLTAATTILGLLPLTTGIDFDWRSFSWVIGGQNTAFWRPMGIAIIFGLSVSTFLTLVVVPSMFLALNNFRFMFWKKKSPGTTVREIPAEV